MSKKIPPLERPVVMHFDGSDDELHTIFNKLGIEVDKKKPRPHLIHELSYLLLQGSITGDRWGTLPCKSSEFLSLVNSCIVKWATYFEFMNDKQRCYELCILAISEPNKPTVFSLKHSNEVW